MKTDLAIIGAGPGGYVAALRAAQLGMQVTIVESTHLGGVCLNRGCIPTKAMLQTAAVAHEVRGAGTFGVVLDGSFSIDYTAALARRDGVVNRLKGGVRGLLKHGKVQIVSGRASFTGPKTLVVEPVGADIGAGKGTTLDQAETIEAEHIIVATGSKPLALPVPGADHPRVLDSDGALALTAVPSSIVVVGAGAVGCEWSQIFARLGATVTLVEMLPAVLAPRRRRHGQGDRQGAQERGRRPSTRAPPSRPSRRPAISWRCTWSSWQAAREAPSRQSTSSSPPAGGR